MSGLLSIAAITLIKREHPRLVAATGLIFQKLGEITDNCDLKDVLESHRGGVWGEEVAPGLGYPVIRSTNMRGVRVNTEDVTWCDIPPAQAEVCALQSGDILVAKSSGSSDLVGKATLFVHPRNDNTYLFSNFTLRLRPNDKVVLPEFVAWFLRSPQSLMWRYRTQQNAVGLRNLRTKEFLAQNIPVPELQIQKTIVTFLNALEERNGAMIDTELPPPLSEQQRIVARIEELAAKIEEGQGLRKQAVEEAEVLMDVTRANVFEEASKFRITPLSSMATLERGKFSHRPRNDPHFFGGDHPWIQIAEIENSSKYIRQWTQTLNDDGLAISRKFPKGTLLVSIAATIGAVGILEFDCCIPDSIVAVTPKLGIDSEYIYHYLGYLRSHLEQVAPQSAQKNINLEILSPLPIPALPLSQQRRIVAYLDKLQSKVDALKHLQAETSEELDALLPSILDKAFKGELD